MVGGAVASVLAAVVGGRISVGDDDSYREGGGKVGGRSN